MKAKVEKPRLTQALLVATDDAEQTVTELENTTHLLAILLEEIEPARSNRARGALNGLWCVYGELGHIVERSKQRRGAA